MTDYSSWIEDQKKITKRSKKTPYDYFDFASTHEQSETLTNLCYLRVLRDAKVIDEKNINVIEQAEKKMTQRKNRNSRFGYVYQKFWKDRAEQASAQRVYKMKLDARERIVHTTISLMQQTAEDVAESSTSTSVANSNEKEFMQEEDHEEASQTSTVPELLSISKNLQLDLSGLNIIDFTNKESRDLFEKSLSKADFRKILPPDVNPWPEEPHCMKLIKNLSQDNLDSRDLCCIIRKPIIEPECFKPSIHYDLRAVEVIAGRWIDLMCSPRSHIPLICGERTSALDSGILILQNIFLHFNDMVHFKWIECETGGTKRHKWDGVLLNTDGDDDLATVMLIEFAGGFGKRDKDKLESDTEKIYRNAARLLNNRYSNQKSKPQIFIVITHDRTIYFESLTWVSDLAYVRQRSTQITVPFSPSGLKAALQTMPEVFTWRDSVIDAVKKTPTPTDNDSFDTYPVPNTP